MCYYTLYNKMNEARGSRPDLIISMIIIVIIQSIDSLIVVSVIVTARNAIIVIYIISCTRR